MNQGGTLLRKFGRSVYNLLDQILETGFVRLTGNENLADSLRKEWAPQARLGGSLNETRVVVPLISSYEKYHKTLILIIFNYNKYCLFTDLCAGNRLTGKETRQAVKIGQHRYCKKESKSMAKNYIQDKWVYKMFKIWISSPDPMLLNNLQDRQDFYRFIKACFDIAGRHPYGKKLDMDIFNASFTEATRDKYPEETRELLRRQSVTLFERIIEYEDTKMSGYIGKRHRIGLEKDDND